MPLYRTNHASRQDTPLTGFRTDIAIRAITEHFQFDESAPVLSAVDELCWCLLLRAQIPLRQGEMSLLRAEHLALAASRRVFPSDLAKSGRDVVLYLNPEAVRLLVALLQHRPAGRLFPSEPHQLTSRFIAVRDLLSRKNSDVGRLDLTHLFVLAKERAL